MRSKIGSGIPSSQSRIQPVAPAVCFLIDKCITLNSFPFCPRMDGRERVLFKREIKRLRRGVIAADFAGDATRFFFE